MKNILIDTCSWIDILTEEENELLSCLDYWNKSKKIKLITHEEVIKEWNTHKNKHRNRFSNSLQTKYKHAKKVLKIENLEIPIMLEPKTRHIDNQIKTIDNLLSEALILETTNKIKTFCIDRTISPKKAPYHNKIDSTKDAYIIFSALDYFNNRSENFLFISSNKNEFGSPENLERVIHPEIIELYNNSKIEYYSRIEWAINDLKNEIPIISSPIISSDLSYEIEDSISIDTSASILDQLYEYINTYFKEFKFIPPHLLIKNTPFKLNSSQSYPYYSLFTINLDNVNLFEIFKTMQISNNSQIDLNENGLLFGDIEDYKEKIKYIFRCLTNNLIYNISDKSHTGDSIDIKYIDNKTCNCAKCSFRKFNFLVFFNSLTAYTEAPEDLIELGYLHYKIGNFINAAETFELAYKKSINESKNSLAFIAKYNLSKLYVFINHNFYNLQRRDEILKKLKNNDLAQLSPFLQTPGNKEIIKWIQEEKFYSSCKNKILTLVEKIVDQYHASLNKGRSFNNNVWTLINEYAELTTFLEVNKIIYDKFTEFVQLTKIFIEGLFASHAINEIHHSRLNHFDDWLIKQLIVNGDTEYMIRTFRRYKLKNIKYKKSNDANESFYDLIDNFFSNSINIEEGFFQIFEDENFTFRDYYNKLFANIITLISYCDLDRNYINTFSLKLIHYLENEKIIDWHKIKNLRLFIKRKGNQITTKNLKKLFFSLIRISKYHDEGVLETICNQIKNKKAKINISKVEFELIFSLAFEECDLCSRKHQTTIIIPIFNIIANDVYRVKIKNEIVECLIRKFNFDLYYQANIFDIIGLDDENFGKSIEVCYPQRINKNSKSLFVSNENFKDGRLNDFINLCFKNKVKFNESKFEKFKKINPYYNWLLDMESYNYQNFDPNWIGEYTTRYYYREIANCKNAKKAIENYLRNNIDIAVEKDYLDIFIRRAWDV